jgi:alpha-tubulin suppressor-like RCC1 family protein
MRPTTAARFTLALAALAACGSCTAILGIDRDYHAMEGDAASDVDAAQLESGTDGPRESGARDGATPIDGGDSGIVYPVDAGAVTKVTAGKFHTCALFGDTGYAKCWGRNDDFGELGNGTGMSSAQPLYAMTPGLQDLFAGAHDTCATRGADAGGSECAGKGGLGELGDGVADADSPVPVPTSAFPSPPTAIASGEAFTCAIVSGGDVWCVGDGTLGELGNGASAISATAVQAQLGGAAKAIAAYYQHACAVMADGTVECWGDDSAGQIGNGNVTPDAGVLVPTAVAGVAGATAIGVGQDFSCALVDDDAGGDVLCWGANASGQLGNGSTTSSPTPVEVQGATGATVLAVGGGHACASILTAGGVLCWGSGGSGQLGNGSSSNSSTPVNVSNVGGYPESLTAGGFHTCALFATPNVQCWGSDDFGQLGDGKTNMDESAPVSVKW